MAAFVSGGFIPPAQRNTNNSAFIHVADWFPTMCNLAGVDPTDNVTFKGIPRAIDGRDVWPVLTGVKPDLGREWLPVTNQSIVWNSTYKLITGAPSVSHCPSILAKRLCPQTHWSTPGCHWEQDSREDWPIVEHNSRNSSMGGFWEFMVCNDAKPCLFNLLEDPQERHNLAEAHPDIVETMRAAMHGRNFPYYTDDHLSNTETPHLTPEELEIFECLPTGQANKQFWDGWEGPCCRRKGE